jgi:uncharacterized protein (TIGR03118 family)
MRYFHYARMALSGLCLIASFSTTAHAGPYVGTNLVSDVPGVAPFTDSNLKNPWGLASSTGNPLWVADQQTGVATTYNGPSGMASSLVVTIPPQGGGAAGAGNPTGVVNNSINGVPTTDFKVGTTPASFLVASLNGTISAWTSGTTALREVDNSPSSAVYTGLALANNGTQNQLYAANSHSGAIDVFGPTFATVFTSGFVDPNLPSGAAPFNIQLINGSLFVTYRSPSGFAAIDTFDTNGGSFRRFATDGPLSQPWGLALAPSSFGPFGGDLLVGNKGDGHINAFNPSTGAFVGTLTDPSGQSITLPGLWGMSFGTGGGFDPNTLYFTEGLNSLGGDLFADGLLGKISVVPEPPSAILLGLGLTLLCGVCHWRASSARRAPRW